MAKGLLQLIVLQIHHGMGNHQDGLSRFTQAHKQEYVLRENCQCKKDDVLD